MNDKYGWRRDPFTKRKTFHNGLDMDGTYRDTIFATGNGMVEKARWNAGYGRCVVIKHADGYQTLYGHLSRFFVAVGDPTRFEPGSNQFKPRFNGKRYPKLKKMDRTRLSL